MDEFVRMDFFIAMKLCLSEFRLNQRLLLTAKLTNDISCVCKYASDVVNYIISVNYEVLYK